MRVLEDTISILPSMCSLPTYTEKLDKLKDFPKPKALKTSANTNKPLFCEYHNSYRHKTKDCYDLSRAVDMGRPTSKVHYLSEKPLKERSIPHEG